VREFINLWSPNH